MSKILVVSERDPLKRGKDCSDFFPLDDGTKSGDPIYCKWSFQCKQLGMVSNWHRYVDLDTGEPAMDYLCTGILANFENRKEDNEAK